MKKKSALIRRKKTGGGGPGGIMISLLIHAGAFFVASLFVVFTVVTKADPEFVAPTPMERPRMNLKKPKVKVKKSSQPKPSSRIVAKVKTRDMPEIQLPDLVGAGDGLMGGIGIGGDFLDLPEVGEPTVFGGETSSGNDLVGTFYDFKRRNSGAVQPIDASPGTIPNAVDSIVHRFMEQDWDRSSLSRFYRSPRKLYTSCICIGTVQSTVAPEAFGEMDTEGFAWAVLYEGKLVYPEDIRFRFRGVGDKFLAVRVNGKVVLLCIYDEDVRNYFSDIWTAHASGNRLYPMAEGKQTVGDWIELKGGEPVDIQIMLGDRQGGLVYQQLAVEVDGAEYSRNPYGGGPRLPVFKTDNLTRAQIDAMYVDVYEGDICLTNGPVFCDYFPAESSPSVVKESGAAPVFLKDDVRAMRTWCSVGGQSLDARLLLQAEDYVLLETISGEQRKIPSDQLSAEDQYFLDLSNPPELRVEFSKTSDQVQLTTLGPYDNSRPLAIVDYTFGVKMKSASSVDYNHPLTVEYFAIGEEVRNGDNYILLDRKSDTVVPGKERHFKHEFHGRTIRLRKYANRPGCPFRGRETSGYLVLVTDAAGRIVQYETSNEFLFRNMDRLRNLPVNAYFDNTCMRTYPTRPNDRDRATWNLME
ncbi:MAG: hypothetical protein JXR25_00020 [Pontiellaceae bacterium]|nr:hypothetical protein [Pontiellaceae bacterium]MBN2783184.1 hypothetical protein [Pontiellaceae bacterium]